MSTAARGAPEPGVDTAGAEETQRETVALLSAPGTHGGEEVERVDTHVSRLFLAGDRVLKLKRAVTTDFLDFSTSARRLAACLREVEINSRVAPDLYHGVRPVVRTSAGLALGELGARPGRAVDWVVEMTRFDRTRQLDRLAAEGLLDEPTIRRLADVVAQMHRTAPLAPEFGGAARVRATVHQIHGSIAGTPAATRLAPQVVRWREEADAAVDRHARRLDTRRRHGFVRRCHGDLHLGNIVVHRGRPTPFDALEFNEEMASTDVLYDIAFTIMDLVEREQRPLANAFLNRYLGATRDHSGLALLPLFVSMRAAVRALVAAMSALRDPHAPTADERLDFARRALVPGPPPRLVAVGGLSGSGKSTVAREIAPRLGGSIGAVVLRSDEIRKRLHGVDPETALPAAAYAPEVTRRVYATLSRAAARTLGAGETAILDATFVDVGERARVEELAARAGAAFRGLWLACEPPELAHRLTDRGEDASDADVTVLRSQLALDPGAGSWTEIPAEGPLRQTVARVLAELQ